jgi:hypothetical protein
MKRIARSSLFLGLIIVLGVALRSVHIDHPDLIDFHSFRQAETASFAHGYLVGSFAPWHPEDSRYPCRFVDRRFGFVESELPLPAWFAVLPLKVLGIDYPPAPYLRAFWIAIYVAASIYLYRLVQRLDRRDTTALATVFAFAVFPLSIFFSRAIMPDGPSLALGIATLYHLQAFLEDRRRRDEILTVVLAAVLLLCKISNAYIAFPFVYLLCRREGVLKAAMTPRYWIWAVLIAIPVYAWYAYARTAPWTFGIWDHPTKNKFSSWNSLTDWSLWRRFWMRLRVQILGWPGIVLSLLGLLVGRKSESVRVGAAWCFGYLVFLVAAINGNAMHVYYQLPVTVAAALATGAAIAWLIGTEMPRTPFLPRWGRVAGVFALAGALLLHVQTTYEALAPSIDNRDAGFFRDRTNHNEAIRLLGRHAPKGKLIATMESAPEIFYNSGTRGYMVGADEDALRACTADGGVVLVTRKFFGKMKAMARNEAFGREFSLVEQGHGVAIWKRSKAGTQ